LAMAAIEGSEATARTAAAIILSFMG